MKISKKIVLLGQFGVGKSSLLRRFLENVFETDYKPTLGVQIKKKMLDLPSGDKLSMIIWDLEGFMAIAKARASYLLGSEGFIYVFDVTRPITYENLEQELDFIALKYNNVALQVIGNKCDLENHDIAKNHLEKKGIMVHSYVSAKTGEGVQEVFTDLAKKLSK
ncbi:Rab family GTPase [Marinirhabdus gelatinilytica]|uniref:Small GTP-binding protein n=1 Tax=Marinirhabdus gelatinilytica TaxID=1703343 RepID=A0A370QJX4_9FLAO|nr:Rab family GTPase [Marinirhabdus gelatinilytica]RDK88360.1 small GTP-binding protein [Marinirhabdus gelatinilytica]